MLIAAELYELYVAVAQQRLPLKITMQTLDTIDNRGITVKCMRPVSFSLRLGRVDSLFLISVRPLLPTPASTFIIAFKREMHPNLLPCGCGSVHACMRIALISC